MKDKVLNQIYCFCQVVECGGFVSASRQYKASAPTLSRAVATLETHCGEKLLHRNAKQFRLTSTGENYYRRFAPLFKALDEQWQDANNAQAELTGDIRISSTVPFVNFFLQDLAVEFIQAHPKVNIHIYYQQDTTRFIDDQIDLAITNTTVKAPYLVQRKLFEVPIGFAAAPDYVEKYGQPKKVTDLPNYDLLLGDTNTPMWQIEQAGKHHKIPINPRYQVDNPSLIQAAAIAGLGICLMPLPILKRLEQTGKLMQLLKDASCPVNKTYLVWLDKKLISSRVKAFRDLLFHQVSPECVEHFIAELPVNL